MKGIIKKLLTFTAVCAATVCLVGNVDVYAAVTHTVTYIYGSKTTPYVVEHGQTAPIPTDTYVPGFTFVGWVGSAFNVTEDRIILGAYNPAADNKDQRNFRVPTSFSDQTQYPVNTYALGIPAQTPTYKFNDNISAPAPEWRKDLDMPKGVPGVTCAVHWYNGWNGEYWKTDIVPYGGTCPDPGNPCIAGFEFVGWEGSWENVTEDRNIRAWYFQTNTVTLVDTVTNDVYDVQHIRNGDSIRTETPYYEGSTFDHFEGKTTDIQNDTTVIAVYN